MTNLRTTALALLATIGCTASTPAQEPSFRFVTVSLPAGSQNVVYAAQLITAHAKGPVVYGVAAGQLPTGLHLDAVSGRIGGRPSVSSNSQLTFSAGDGQTTLQIPLSLLINAAGGGSSGGFTFDTLELSDARQGTAYAASLQTSGGSGPFVFGAAHLPPGLRIDGSTGALHGTPLAAGTFEVLLSAVDRGESENRATTLLPLVVRPASSELRFASQSLDNGALGAAYECTPVLLDAPSSLGFTAVGLPAGLTIDGASGSISGTPTEAGTFEVELRVQGGTDEITWNSRLRIVPGTSSSVHWNDFALPLVLASTAYERQPPIRLDAAGSTTPTYEATGLPSGIVYAPSSGELSGTAHEVGIYPVTFRMTNAPGGEELVLRTDFAVLPASGGSADEIAAPIWISKLQVKPGTGAADGSWKASLIVNADRRAAGIFDRSDDELEVALGDAAVLVPSGAFDVVGSKHDYARREDESSIRVGYDLATERLDVSASGISWTEALPGALDLRVRIGEQSRRLRVHLDERGRFRATAGLRGAAFALSKASIARESSATSALSIDGFLGAAAFEFDPAVDELRVRVLHEGVPVLDRELSDRAVVKTKLDPRSGRNQVQISVPAEVAGPSACTGLRYDSAKGRLRFGFEELDLAELPPAPNPLHLSFEVAFGTHVVTAAATFFAQTPESYSLQGSGGGLSFLTRALPDAEVATAYEEELSVVGAAGHHVWRVDSGELPPGLALVGTSGPTASLSGIPTLAGVFEFTIAVDVGAYSEAQRFQLEVLPGAPSSSGWTEFEPVAGARVIHISATGNDTADGSAATPRRTLDGGFALLRSGFADWLLLKRGDTFALDAPFQWTKSGPSGGNGWMRLGAYGDENLPRPVLLSRDGYLAITPGFQVTSSIRRFAITDIYLWAADRLANSATTTSNLTGIQLVAIQWQGTGFPFSDILLENCRISGFTSGFASSDDVTNLTVRRCIFDHIFGANTTHAGGVLSGATNWLLEENVFYQIMSPDIPGVGANAYSGFAHSAYVNANASNVESRRNICIKCPDGPMQRSGGVYVQNVSAETNIAFNVGQVWGVTPVAGGVDALVQENLALNTIGGNFFLGNLRAGTVQSNLLVRDLDGPQDIDLVLVPLNSTGTGTNIGVHDTDFVSNIVSGVINWNPGDPASYSGLTFTGNQTNVGRASTSIAQYLQAVGWSGSTVDAWAEHLLSRDRSLFTVDHSAISVINFYRAHYGLPPLP